MEKFILDRYGLSAQQFTTTKLMYLFSLLLTLFLCTQRSYLCYNYGYPKTDFFLRIKWCLSYKLKLLEIRHINYFLDRINTPYL